MNILALDFGTKRIGMAWVDTEIGVVLPFGIVEYSNQTKVTVEKLTELIKQEHIQKVVIGLPLGLDGKENENTARIRSFAEELKSKLEIPVEFFDERFSSQAGDRYAGEASRDEKAAMIILENYVTKNKL